MKYIKIILCWGLFSVLFSSCSDFLVSDPVLSEVESTYYSTDAQMFKALMAAYDPLQWSNSISTFVPFGEIRSDNARTGGGGEGDQPDMQAIEDFRNTSVNSISQNMWSRDYSGIYRCNLVINSTYSSDEATTYKAEARFLRAWYHFDLLRTYGPCPISSETVYPTGEKFTRKSREEVNKFIEADLLSVIPVLKKSFDATMKGRITQSAAQALLGKVYIYWADWSNDDKAIFDKAAKQFEAVKSSNLYTLFDNYSQLFAAYQENNSESIFEIQRSTKSGWTSWEPPIRQKEISGLPSADHEVWQINLLLWVAMAFYCLHESYMTIFCPMILYAEMLVSTPTMIW